MSKIQKLVDEWNSLIPSYQIQDFQIQHPQKAFLVYALTAYLNELHIDPAALITQMRNPEDPNSMNLALVWHIDRYFRLAKDRFYYMDLIKPNPKKTFAVLKYLLNYLKYFNFFKNEVSDKLENKLKLHDEYLYFEEQFGALQLREEETKAKNAEIDHLIRNSEKKLKALNKEFETVTILMEEVTRDHSKLKKTKDALAKDLEKAEIEASSLQDKIIDENELKDIHEEIISSNETLQTITENIECHNKEIVQLATSIDEIQESIKKIIAVTDNDISLFESNKVFLNTLQKQIEDIKANGNKQRLICSKLSEDNDNLDMEKQIVQMSYTQLKEENIQLAFNHNGNRNDFDRYLLTLKNTYETLLSENNKLKEELIILNKQLDYVYRSSMAIIINIKKN